MYDKKFTGKRVVDGKTYLDIERDGVTISLSGPMAEAVKDYPLDALSLNVWSDSVEISVYLYIDRKVSSKDYAPKTEKPAEAPADSKKNTGINYSDAETVTPDGNEIKGAA